MGQTLSVNWDGENCLIEGEILKNNRQWSLKNEEKVELFLVDDRDQSIYDTAGKQHITFSQNAFDDVIIENIEADLVLFREQKGLRLEVHDGKVFHNYTLTNGNILIESGDHLFFDGVRVIVHEGDIQVIPSGKKVSSSLVPLIDTEEGFSPDYPDYHRSPRIIYREPEQKRTIAKPSPLPSKPSEQLARTIVPPLVMILALVIISLIQPRGIFIIVMLAMTVTTVIFSVTSYIKSVRKYKADMKHRDKTFKEYLRRKTKELYHVTEEQRHALEYHYPDVEKMRELILQVNARIYEKTLYHHDFLHFRAGLGDVETSFEIEFREEEFTQDKDELVDAARDLLSHFEGLKNVPIVTSLMKGPVGYIGQRELVIEQLQLLMTQVSLFHSYHDVQFITIFPEDEKSKWDWMRWFPHASLQDLNVRGFVYHERSRDQVLHSMYQVLKERKQLLTEKANSNEKRFYTSLCNFNH
ncbi:FtsK/SpoIIIE family protein [Gracilibacillus boraciitolerans JCM 21714]|uniref:FtsK/SpoIIIE family protein n=1 Tax=Gracilibacillus boraciitolerans JCM 21714 TaxID=1298598 RepID=W4VNU7_9BACI|nr:FtsK/SpoIIIE family protein [Gracilibacillus boraciitolerans JCM 21714]